MRRTVAITERRALTERQSPIRRMQKSLIQMNLQLHTVLSDITGMTGMKILRDIVRGVTDPNVLAAHRNGRCHASEEEIEASLTGHYRDEHIFTLSQQLALYDFYQRLIKNCDENLEQLLETLASAEPEPAAELPDPRSRFQRNANTPKFDIRPMLYRLTGEDITQIHGIAPHSSLTLISEIGTDMTRWRTEKHFTSWLTLSPRNKISGDRILSSRTQPSANRAAQTLRMCAVSVGRTDTALGAYYRRLAYRIGKAKAVTATARKLAILVYRTLRRDIIYTDQGAESYEASDRNRMLRNLQRKAQKLGLSLLDSDTGELVSGVS